MKTIRHFAVAVVFLAVASLNSFGYSILCQSAAKGLSVHSSLVTMFSCAIPAGAVGTGQSIRVTTSFHGNSTNLTSYLFLNGSEAFTEESISANQEHTWSFIITSNTATGWSISGIRCPDGGPIGILGSQNSLYTGALPWSTGWTLQMMVSYETSTSYEAYGDTFVVEILK
jgi:hypothetical protein